MRYITKNRNYFRRLVAGPLFIATLPVPLQAEAVDTRVLEEVIVTAQRKEQSLQSVPLSVTAFGAEALKESRVTDSLALSEIAEPPRVLRRLHHLRKWSHGNPPRTNGGQPELKPKGLREIWDDSSHICLLYP